MQQFGWLSLVPPVVAIALALGMRRVIPALALAILIAAAILADGQRWRVPTAALDRVVATATVPDNFRLVLCSVLVGGLIALLRHGAAFEGLAHALQRDRPTIRRRTLFGATWALGAALFLETWSNILVNGTALGAMFDRAGISRQRMAYFMHTIAIGCVALIPFNSWAAFYLGLLVTQQVRQPFQFLLASIPFVLYCWVSLVLTLVVMASGWTIGPLRRFEPVAGAPVAQSHRPAPAGKAANAPEGSLMLLLLPLLTFVGVAVMSLTLTGGGDPRSGNGAAAVLYAVVAASAVAAVILRATGVSRPSQVEETFVAGCGRFVGAAALVLLALTLGQMIRELGTGGYVAGLFAGSLPRALYAPLIFVVGALVSFATGTSYGTFSIMTPIAIALAHATGADAHLLFGACVAGGVFGDNCSPISDTSIVTSIATQTTVVDHVTTQLPYALVAAGITTAGFCLLGVLKP